MEYDNNEKEWFTPRRKLVALLVVGALAIGGAIIAERSRKVETQPQGYPWHENITATMFWVGEGADNSNDHIHNRSSTWDVDWMNAFGGVDDPKNRCGHNPCGFTPAENVFYAAVPYNDLDSECNAKSTQKQVYWYREGQPKGYSFIKNSWIEVEANGKTVYAQIEDAGPFGEDDFGYVFGDSQPREERAGLDLSPAAIQYLGIDGRGQVAWRFVDEAQVPEGPWRTTITRSPTQCQE